MFKNIITFNEKNQTTFVEPWASLGGLAPPRILNLFSKALLIT